MTEHSEHENSKHGNGEHENGERGNGDEPIEELADEAIEENPDEQTRRETFELELMEEHRSEEGTAVDLEEEGEDHDSK